jgi:hypothetical protein
MNKLFIGIMTPTLIIFIFFTFLAVDSYKLLSEAENEESYKCPVFKCSVVDPDCSFAPYRCLANDPSSSTCTVPNKVCMKYDITQDKTTKTSLKK